MGKRGAVANGGVAHPRPTVMFQADDPITKLLAAAEHDPAIPGPAIDADIPEEARALEVLAEHMDEAGVNQATRELFTLAFLDREQGGALVWGAGKIKEAINQGAKLDYCNQRGLTLLHLSAAAGNINMVSSILKLQIIPVDKADHYGRTPLHEATANGKEKVVVLLLESGANLYAETHEGQTALHIAARYDQSALIVFLLSQVSTHAPPWDVDKLDKKLLSAKRARMSSVGPSLRKEADPGTGMEFDKCPCRSGSKFRGCHDSDSFRADLRKRALNSTRIRGDIIKTSAFLSKHQHDLPSASTITPNQRIFRDIRDAQKQTALHVACVLDRDTAAKTLLDLGSDPGVLDYRKQGALKAMVANMPMVAAESLDYFVQIDRPARKTYAYLGDLEPGADPAHIQDPFTKLVVEGMVEEDEPLFDFEDIASERSLLEEIVYRKRLGLVNKEALRVLINRKWISFARSSIITEICFYSFFLLCLTVACVTANNGIAEYSWDNYWRIPFEIIVVLFLCAYVVREVMEVMEAVNDAKRRKAADEKLLVRRLRLCNRMWHDFRYLRDKLEDRHDDSLFKGYLDDRWNIMDLCSYSLLISAYIAHIVDIAAPYGNEAAAKTYIRLLVIACIIAWIKLLKFARAFDTFGPFVVMLGNMGDDIVKFLFLFVDLLIPFSTAFYVLWGNGQLTTSHPLEPSFRNFGTSMVTLFRMTVVDMDYDSLEEYDHIMAPILVVMWLFFSGILFINLFIAMMSNTFQAVYDNARDVAIMETASAIVSVEQGLRKSRLAKHRADIQMESPLSQVYDDPDEQEYKLPNLRAEIMDEVTTHTSQLSLLKDMLDEVRKKMRIERRSSTAFHSSGDLNGGTDGADGADWASFGAQQPPRRVETGSIRALRPADGTAAGATGQAALLAADDAPVLPLDQLPQGQRAALILMYNAFRRQNSLAAEPQPASGRGTPLSGSGWAEGQPEDPTGGEDGVYDNPRHLATPPSDVITPAPRGTRHPLPPLQLPQLHPLELPGAVSPRTRTAPAASRRPRAIPVRTPQRAQRGGDFQASSTLRESPRP